jgi:hypothetical protein
MNYNIMCYLNRQLVPVDMEGESLPDAINNLINDQGDNLGPIVMVKQAEFYMAPNGHVSGVPEEI